MFIFILTYSYQLGVLFFESQSVFLSYYFQIEKILKMHFIFSPGAIICVALN